MTWKDPHLNYGDLRMAEVTYTFVTATTGATGAHDLFQVTGDVRIAAIFAKCTTNLTGAATLQVGVAGNVEALSGEAFADATTWDAGEWWANAGADSVVGGSGALYNGNFGTALDIILTIGSTAVTAGVAQFYCLWAPLSEDGLVTGDA